MATDAGLPTSSRKIRERAGLLRRCVLTVEVFDEGHAQALDALEVLSGDGSGGLERLEGLYLGGRCPQLITSCASDRWGQEPYE